jgi:hypothetical protein
MSTAPRVLYCHCAFAQVVPADVKSEVLDGLAASGRDFEAVPDLCEMSARRDPRLRDIAAGGDTVLVACYPRAVRWLFNAAGAELPATGIRVLNMRVHDARRILTAVEDGSDPDTSASPEIRNQR